MLRSTYRSRVHVIEPNRPLREVLCAVLEKAEYVTNICTSPLDLLRYPATGLGEVAVLDLSWYGQEPIQAEHRHCLRLLSEVLPLVVLAEEPGSFTHGLLGAPRVIVISKPLEV